jgi:hypothetical protein
MISVSGLHGRKFGKAGTFEEAAQLTTLLYRSRNGTLLVNLSCQTGSWIGVNEGVVTVRALPLLEDKPYRSYVC